MSKSGVKFYHTIMGFFFPTYILGKRGRNFQIHFHEIVVAKVVQGSMYIKVVNTTFDIVPLVTRLYMSLQIYSYKYGVNLS